MDLENLQYAMGPICTILLPFIPKSIPTSTTYHPHILLAFTAVRLLLLIYIATKSVRQPQALLHHAAIEEALLAENESLNIRLNKCNSENQELKRENEGLRRIVQNAINAMERVERLTGTVPKR